jgi:hypothetical protein
MQQRHEASISELEKVGQHHNDGIEAPGTFQLVQQLFRNYSLARMHRQKQINLFLTCGTYGILHIFSDPSRIGLCSQLRLCNRDGARSINRCQRTTHHAGRTWLDTAGSCQRSKAAR